MIKPHQIKSLSPLLIWYGFSIYSALTIAFTDSMWVKAHYINLTLIAIATFSFALGNATGQLTTLFMLVFGVLSGGTLMVSVSYLSIGEFKLYWSYLPLIIYFILINKSHLNEWYKEVFNK